MSALRPKNGHVRSGRPLWADSGHGREFDAFIRFNSSSLTQKSRIESRIASTGNRTLGSGQASENIALTRDDVLAKLRCIPITAAHNIVGPCNASCGKFFLVLLQALEHVVCLNRHTATLSFKFLAARYRSSSVSRIVLRLSSRS